MPDNFIWSMPDDASVARPISDRLKRQTRTLGQALGAVITTLRVRKQWSQGQLAKRSGYEVSSISRVERGKTNPTMAFVIVMADTFKVRPSQLLARAERRTMKHGQTALPVGVPNPPKSRQIRRAVTPA